MTLRVVGAGLGRTGTLSLKLALERLLGGSCYHMFEVFRHPEHVPLWTAACRGELPDWERLFEGYAATVDWPSGAFWPELIEAFPDALVLLSTRDPDDWWRSASRTIFPRTLELEPGPWREMVETLWAERFTMPVTDEAAVKAAFLDHNARVRAEVPAGRLLEWSPGDGWEPICAALGCPVPDVPFPHRNTTAEFLERVAPPDA